MLSQVTHHSAIFPPSMRNTAPKSNRALRPEGGNGPIAPCCVPSYVVHAATRFPSATRSLIVWTEIGKNRRILPQKFLDLIKAPSLDTRRCFAMANNIRCDKLVERIRLTTVPRVEKTPDYGLVL